MALGAAPLSARTPPPGELTLDAARPAIAATIGGQPVRLRVDPAQWGTIELNPDAAARLGLKWEPGRDLAIGRTTLWGRTAPTVLEVAGRKRPALAATHDRVAAAEADGVIGPDLLPFAGIVWRRADAPPPTGTTILPLTLDPQRGLEAAAPDLAPGLAIRFSLAAAETSATAAAGALLAQRLGGSFDGPARPVAVMLGVTRPARPIRFGRAFRLAGFRLDTVLVRVADFRGENALPDEPAPPGDITVAHRERPQIAQPWISLGLDRLGRCAEITYRTAPRTLSLSCAFEP